MHKYVHKIILRAVDGALYLFIGPYSVLYIIPRFLMNVSNIKSQAGFGIPVVETVGLITIWCSAVLAIWCMILMFLFGKGSPLVTSAPQKILNRNIYAYVRNPMMWSLIFVVLGQALMYGQLILFAWLITLSRILHLVVVNYEEPQLERRFGESWKEYCQKVPRWFPHFRKDKATAAIIRPHEEFDHGQLLRIRNKST
ncbi:MAG: isoprenylcysteine carboxylmethyltransferase family protein [Syntrophaceae bacterium]|nr:isoprenylcysteine carboxylmethyltransferase family protein [Syntrophaceae bacterium]